MDEPTDREARARRVLDEMGVDTSDAAILLALLGYRFP